MSNPMNGTDHLSLPAELELALGRATLGALSALQSLRSAVRDHVHEQCVLGVSHNTISDNLRSMITTCGQNLDRADYSADRADEVTKQVIVWSTSFYRRVD